MTRIRCTHSQTVYNKPKNNPQISVLYIFKTSIPYFVFYCRLVLKFYLLLRVYAVASFVCFNEIRLHVYCCNMLQFLPK